MDTITNNTTFNPYNLASSSREECKTLAAIKIQSVWRGYAAKVKVEKAKKHILSYALLEKAKTYIDKPSNFKDVPRANSGKTTVYLPKELPLVLKMSASPQSRYNHMKQARDICERSNYKNLVIPRARVYKHFIVESRLPISWHDTKRQIGLYIENRDRFTVAVKEFTGFLFQSYFGDITGETYDPYDTLSKTPIGRYDNVPLFLDGEQGKIGLIDLEDFAPREEKPQDFRINACIDAVRLFPLHLDDIIDVAVKFGIDKGSCRLDLEAERDGALKRFKLAYEDHVTFLKENGITIENPFKMIDLSPAREEFIKNVIISRLNKRYLGDNPEETVKLFAKSLPKIIGFINDFFREWIKLNIKVTGDAISSNAELAAYRTACVTAGNEIYRKLVDKVLSELPMMKIERWDQIDFSLLMLRIIFEELSKGKEIAYYNPSFGLGGRAEECIFF